MSIPFKKSPIECNQRLHFPSNIIVAQYLSLNANDKNEVKPAIENLKVTTGTLPSKLSADNGYMSGDNLEALYVPDLDAYVATDKGEKKNKIPLDDSKKTFHFRSSIWREHPHKLVMVKSVTQLKCCVLPVLLFSSQYSTKITRLLRCCLLIGAL